MVRLEQVSKSFQGYPVLRNVSFSLAPGEVVGLVGPSGSGKSVLLKLLGRVMEPERGEILLDGDEAKVVETGFLFQEGALFDSMSVIENVAFPMLARDASSDTAFQSAYAVLKEVGLAKAYRKMPGQLSGGMRRRVGLARALVARPRLVLLDDPTGGLDPVAASVIMNLIRRLHALYMPTVMMVSHDIRRLLPRVERVLALFEGEVACDLPTTELPRLGPEKVVRFLATRYDFSRPEA